jgi:hypothetical protein
MYAEGITAGQAAEFTLITSTTGRQEKGRDYLGDKKKEGSQKAPPGKLLLHLFMLPI